MEHGWDAALTRLEDVLLGLPFDRALPDLADILAAASVSEAQLRSDDRALKVLHEAIVARPLADVDEVGSLRTRVELLTLEVGVLTERMAAPDATVDDLERASARLADVRGELQRVHRLL